MKKIITFSFCLIAIMALSFRSVAQDFSANTNEVTEVNQDRNTYVAIQDYTMRIKK